LLSVVFATNPFWFLSSSPKNLFDIIANIPVNSEYGRLDENFGKQALSDETAWGSMEGLDPWDFILGCSILHALEVCVFAARNYIVRNVQRILVPGDERWFFSAGFPSNAHLLKISQGIKEGMVFKRLILKKLGLWIELKWLLVRLNWYLWTRPCNRFKISWPAEQLHFLKRVYLMLLVLW
jgi:hypothetical protein